MKILVAEADAEHRATVAASLQARHVDVVEAADGLAVVRHVTSSRLRAVAFDGVVMDLRLPRLEGLEVLRRIRAFDGRLAVIVTTAMLDPSSHRQARALGARAVLVKPV